jgi:hypothetical protein
MYHESSERKLTFKLVDVKKQMIEFIDTNDVVVIPTSKNDEVPYDVRVPISTSYEHSGEVIETDGEVELTKFLVDGVDKMGELSMKNKKKVEVDDYNDIEKICSTVLLGEDRYEVSREVKGSFSLLAENCFLWKTEHPLLNTRVSIKVIGSGEFDLVAELAGYGTPHKFIRKKAEAHELVEYHYKDIILPGHGYLTNLKIVPSRALFHS